MKIRTSTAAAIAAATSIVSVAPAIASPTAFTYQGQLVQDGEPANGAFEFQIRLLDDLGTQIGMTQFANAVVNEGTFTMEIDFGPAAFNASERFLELSVRALSDGGPYITLTPNQRVTSAPIAQFALAGNEGPQGPQGPQGEPGQDGTDGAPGADGQDGAQGPEGPQGPQGTQGPQGVQGPQGDEGPAGDSHWLISGTRTYYNDGYVGIGWDNPTNPLFVRTELDETAIYGLSLEGTGIRAQSTAADGIGISGQATSFSGPTIGGMFEAQSSSGTAVRAYAFASAGTNYAIRGTTNSEFGFAGYFEGGKNYFEGRVGVGTVAPTDEIHVNAPAGQSAFRVQHDGLTRIRVNANGGVSLGGNSTIVPAGDTYVVNNLGIGENEPTAKLHVNAESGRVPLEILTNGTRRMHMTSSGGITLGGTGSSTAGDVYIVNDLGIGDNSPSAKLDINGDPGRFSLVVASDGTDALLVNSTATVFIPEQLSVSTASGHNFDMAVGGSAAKTGGGSWAVFSDQRLKKNITPMLGSLDTIAALRPVNFEYTDKDHFSYVEGVQHGFIAQEVQQVIPQWVGENSDGYLYLDQVGFEALVVDAIQELREENHEQIQKLQAENDRQQREIEAMRTMLLEMKRQLDQQTRD
jgi:hypothetical protein